ncbi:Hpt domain-containing protein [Arthrobacter sp. JZ12]|uniref:Hpt domain-containing protein n=1 Tax=Arthrobacter sp. JZ12 TaxID=2654190 RepID=UPI002B484136|nr:Hpt domain-containing protein [Arthrobacter sp. JZ12]WRH26023.1 Hpt domain-containing protein [Arthrobacter sp. JZ12]
MSKHKRPPLVNLKVLHQLEDEFGDPGPAHTFVQDFVDFWDERYLRLVEAVRSRDTNATHEAIRSVRISSSMVGASRLAELAGDLESNLKRGNLDAVAHALPQVKDCGAATITKLTTKYINSEW